MSDHNSNSDNTTHSIKSNENTKNDITSAREDKGEEEELAMRRLESMIDARIELKLNNSKTNYTENSESSEDRIEALIRAVNTLSTTISTSNNNNDFKNNNDIAKDEKDDNTSPLSDASDNLSVRVDALVRVVERMADHLQVL